MTLTLFPIWLIPPEHIPRIYLFGNVIQAGIIAVGDDGVGEGLEAFEVVYYKAAEEGGAVFKGGFVDDYSGPFGFDAFHYPLD